MSAFYKVHDPQSTDLAVPLLTHCAIWSVVGAIGGVAFGLGIGGKHRWKSTLAGGLLGAAVATVFFEISGALVFASDKTDLPLSSSAVSRATAHLLVAILTAVGVVVALRQSVRPEASAIVNS